jgi:hypothetical protein
MHSQFKKEDMVNIRKEKDDEYNNVLKEIQLQRKRDRDRRGSYDSSST